MKLALADKPAIPFRVPAGIKLIRVDAKTGMRAGPGDSGRTILEAFKPGTAPPDNYSVIGVADADGRLAARRRRTPIAACSVPAPAGSISALSSADRSRKAREAIALCARAPLHPSQHYQRGLGRRSEKHMRAEVERLVEEIKQSVGLLRRHL